MHTYINPYWTKYGHTRIMHKIQFVEQSSCDKDVDGYRTVVNSKIHFVTF